MVELPSHNPLQLTFDVPETAVLIADGSVIITDSDAVQPLKSLTVIVLIPAFKFVGVKVVCWPGLHNMVYGGAPPLTVAVAFPFPAPLQFKFVELVMSTIGPVLSSMFAFVVALQPFASVTTTLYELAFILLIHGV